MFIYEYVNKEELIKVDVPKLRKSSKRKFSRLYPVILECDTNESALSQSIASLSISHRSISDGEIVVDSESDDDREYEYGDIVDDIHLNENSSREIFPPEIVPGEVVINKSTKQHIWYPNAVVKNILI
uniref:ELM2 domain-containing protein n=1 Tax=Parastrongyloides trichosuri TaxID=131310 RepID=A0A0N5A6Y1_PARTI